MRTIVAGLLVSSAIAIASPVLAQTQTQTQTQDNDATFGLGQIVVTAPKVEGVAIGGDTLSSDAIFAFDRQRLDDAVNLIPGVNSSNTGGSRNERLILVRGFNRFQAPLSIDGVRVFLPADNRLDYGRFLTSDIAEIQVAKGYASVLDGPDGMGGAINLVTRKPTQPIEAQVQATLNLGREVEYAGYNVAGLIGTRQDKWYAGQLRAQLHRSLGSRRRLRADAKRGWRAPRPFDGARLARKPQGRVHPQ